MDDEPLKKKFKVDATPGEDEEDACHSELDVLQEHLLKNCLCALPDSMFEKSLRSFHADDSLWKHVILDWNREKVLQTISCVQLLCEIAIKQNGRGYVCSRIAGICDALTGVNEGNNLIDYFVDFANHSDHFVCFAASRALSSFFLIARNRVDERWLSKLADNVLITNDQAKMSFSLDVMKRIIEWTDTEDHILEESNEGEMAPGTCRTISTAGNASLDYLAADSALIKCACIKSLITSWPAITNRFHSFISANSYTYQSTIITFLDLWRAIISVKANLSVLETKLFYSNLDALISLLSSNVAPVVWKHSVDLFNEVLCYGSTLALQEVLADEPCSLAHIIVRSVKTGQFLNAVPYRQGSGRFGGGCGDGDKTLLKKVILLVLKGVAVTVKETRCDSSASSSSDSSSSSSSFNSSYSDADAMDADMALIEKSIRQVLKQLDSCVKTLLPFHPETSLAQWIVQIFADQDDALVESMICCLDVTIGLCYTSGAFLDLHRSVLSPTTSFLQFLTTVSFDSDVLLDFLISNETSFLLYLLRFLKYITRNWNEFYVVCCRQTRLHDVMTVFIRLKMAIERLVSKDLFPYNINPILALLGKCEYLFEHEPAQYQVTSRA